MAYTKQTWVDNETPINADRMNHIEDGIEGAYNAKTLYIKDVDGLKKLSWKSNTFDPVDFGTVFNEAFSSKTSFSVDSGINYVEPVIQISTTFNGETANTIRTATMTFVQGGNNELILIEKTPARGTRYFNEDDTDFTYENISNLVGEGVNVVVRAENIMGPDGSAWDDIEGTAFIPIAWCGIKQLGPSTRTYCVMFQWFGDYVQYTAGTPTQILTHSK